MSKLAFSLIGALTLLAVRAGAQSPTIYAESFRKGPTRITEQKYEAKLDLQNPTYRERIRDSAGDVRYELSLAPKSPEGETRITSWTVSLRDLRHTVYGNLLQFDQELSEQPKDNLFWLNPMKYAVVPIRAKRIIKVDSFYLVFQVKDMRFTEVDSPYLDAMTVEVEFTNSDPMKQAQ